MKILELFAGTRSISKIFEQKGHETYSIEWDKQFENISESAKDLISKCLIRDKNKRITIKEAMKHEFFAGEIDISNIFEDEVITKNVLNNLKINSRQTSKFYQIVLNANHRNNLAEKQNIYINIFVLMFY